MEPAAQAVAALSCITFLLMLPPLLWHSISRNIPAMFLMAWLAYSNLITFINILIWGGETSDSWEGKGYCDVVVKLNEAASPGKIAAAAAIAMNLYFVLRAKPLLLLDHHSKRKKAVELAICLLTSIFVMCTSYAVQYVRYRITRYAGCETVLRTNVGAILLFIIWPFIWALVAIVFAALTLFKFLQQRRDVANILRCTNSGLNLRRFGRLLLFVTIVILALAPVTIFQFAENVKAATSGIKEPEADFRNIIYFEDANLSQMYGHYVDMCLSVLAFVVFGTGADALSLYLKIFCRILPRRIKDMIFNRNRDTQLDSAISMNETARFESNAETAWSKSMQDIEAKEYKTFEECDFDESRFPTNETMYHAKTYAVKTGTPDV